MISKYHWHHWWWWINIKVYYKATSHEFNIWYGNTAMINKNQFKVLWNLNLKASETNIHVNKQQKDIYLLIRGHMVIIDNGFLCKQQIMHGTLTNNAWNAHNSVVLISFSFVDCEARLGHRNEPWAQMVVARGGSGRFTPTVNLRHRRILRCPSYP